MKKLATFLVAIVLLVLLLQSCGVSDQCAAYGEYKRYRVESR